MSMSHVEEFYNTCHAKEHGKFCKTDTGGGNYKGRAAGKPHPSHPKKVTIKTSHPKKTVTAPPKATPKKAEPVAAKKAPASSKSLEDRQLETAAALYDDNYEVDRTKIFGVNAGKGREYLDVRGFNGGDHKGIPKSDFTDEQTSSLVLYSNYDFKPMNEALRDGATPDDPITARAVKGMDGAFKAAKPTTADITVYRGVDLDMDPKFMDKGFVSTSDNKDIAERFGTLIKITIPAGAKVIQLKSGTKSGESEILLDRGSKFELQPDGSYRVVV